MSGGGALWKRLCLFPHWSSCKTVAEAYCLYEKDTNTVMRKNVLAFTHSSPSSGLHTTDKSQMQHLQAVSLLPWHAITHKNTQTNTVQQTDNGQLDWFNHVGQSCGWWKRCILCDEWPLGSCPAADKAPIPAGLQSNQSPQRLGGNDYLRGRAPGQKLLRYIKREGRDGEREKKGLPQSLLFSAGVCESLAYWLTLSSRQRANYSCSAYLLHSQKGWPHARVSGTHTFIHAN